MQAMFVKVPAAVHQGCLRHYAGGKQPLIRVIAFPWCGAGASVYRKLAFSLPAHIQLLSVQLPGREDRFRERRLVRMQEIVDHVIADIMSVFDRPLVLFGHSMGALVAYEAALALRGRAGREPSSLIVSGHGAPHYIDSPKRPWHTADEAELLANVRQLGGTPGRLLEDHAIMRTFVPVLKADYEVIETYGPDGFRPLSCPLVACAGEQDTEVTTDNMSAWLQYTTGPAKLHWFEGDHFYLASQPHVLARRMEEWMRF